MRLKSSPMCRGALFASCLWTWRYLAWSVLALCSAVAVEVIGLPKNELMMLACFGTAFVVLYLMLVPRSHDAKEACSILVLRGFEHESRAALYSRLLPVVGCYGRILALRDPKKAPRDEWIWLIVALQLTDLNEHLVESDRTWKDRVVELLSKSDVVVVDVSRHTESVLWELRTTLDMFDPARIIVVGELSPTVHDSFDQAAMEYLRCNKSLCDLKVAMYPSRRFFIARFWKLWPFKLERLVYKHMKEIEIRADA